MKPVETVLVEPQASVPPFVSLNELDLLCRQHPIHYLVEGFLPADEVHVAVGDSGLGKTPWAYQLGLCVSTGKPFLGYPTRQGRVLYLDLENGPEAVLQVAESLCDHLRIKRFPDEFLVRSDETIPERLEDTVAEYKPSLVIVDTLRPFRPGAETKNEEMGRLLNDLRATARNEHCAILLLHHIRKPGENGPKSLEDTPILEWLLQAAGARALINQTNTRIAFDYYRQSAHEDAALVMKFFIKMKAETGPVYLERKCADGEPIGYRRMVGPKLLCNGEQEASYERLPEQFTFADAKSIYGRADDPTRKFLLKCMGVGILEQPVRKGPYNKVVSVEEVEKVESTLRLVDGPPHQDEE